MSRKTWDSLLASNVRLRRHYTERREAWEVYLDKWGLGSVFRLDHEERGPIFVAILLDLEAFAVDEELWSGSWVRHLLKKNALRPFKTLDEAVGWLKKAAAHRGPLAHVRLDHLSALENLAYEACEAHDV